MKNRLKKIQFNIKFFDFLEPSEVTVNEYKSICSCRHRRFWIAPVEAQSTGTPVIAYNICSLSETVVEGKTGVFFNSQSVDAILEALIRFKRLNLIMRLLVFTLTNSQKKFCNKYSKLH